MSKVHHRSALALAALAFTACEFPRTQRVATDAVVERETIGDTTVVRTVSGSAWGDTARLVEDLRIGALEGREELNFGRIGHVEVARDGSIFVYDAQAVALRQFDSAGTFVRTLGRRGQGPGEHQALVGMGFLKDGRLASYDPRNQRINVYSPTDGSIVDWPVRTDATATFGPVSFMVDTTGSMLLLMSLTSATPTGPRRIAFFRLSPDTPKIDTILVPTFPPGPPSVRLSPGGRWARHPHGYFISGINDRYSFDILRPDGVIRVQRTVPRPEFVAAEREEWEAELAGAGPDISSVEVTRGKAPAITYGEKPTLAEQKPFYKALLAAEDGRIWVELHTEAREHGEAQAALEPARTSNPGRVPLALPGQAAAPRRWREPMIYDVFEPDGRYLGAVTVPDGVTLHVMRGDRAWGTLRGESDEEYVVRFRLQLPASARTR